MKCACCGLEMVIYSAGKTEDGKRETVYSCRNRACPEFDARLARKTERNEEAK